MFRLQEADLGFHLIIDRRNDKWNSVKTVLLKISVSKFIYMITVINNHFTKLYYLIIIIIVTINSLYLYFRHFSLVQCMQYMCCDLPDFYRKPFRRCRTNCFERISSLKLQSWLTSSSFTRAQRKINSPSRSAAIYHIVITLGYRIEL